MIVVVRGGHVYTPEPIGRASVMIFGDRIAHVGDVSLDAVSRLGVPVTELDATGALVAPGLVDGHEHLLGGSGERGFASQTPEIFLAEVVLAGITTVVGCLGVDATTKTMPGLLAKARAFADEGLGAYVYTGGYEVPPVTLTGSVRSDMLFVPEVLGAGEIAIADRRGAQPTVDELARLASECYAAGLLTGKRGVLHLHVGDGPARLAPVRRLLEDHDIAPETVYPTHVQRNDALLREAVELTRRGVTVDMDTFDADLVRSVRRFLELGGEVGMLSASSDASIPSPRTLTEQVGALVREGVLPLERALGLVTTTPARALGLLRKGALCRGADADVVVLEGDALRVRHVVAGGRVLVRDGRLAVVPRYLEKSNRTIEAHGEKA